MSHVTHINEPCHTYKWAISHVSCHTTYEWAEWVMPHVQTSHATHMNESQWAMLRAKASAPHKWMSMGHVTHMNEPNESCHTYKRVMSHNVWMSRVIPLAGNGVCATHMNENGSCHTYEWVTSYNVRAMDTCALFRNESCATRTNASYPAYKWVMSHK